MESLFRSPAPKRGRVCLMLGASLVLHGGIVGVAGLWVQPEPAPHTVPFDLGFDTPGGGTPIFYSPVTPSETPTQVDATPTPDVVEQPIPTPPIFTQDPEMEEPTLTPPPRHSTVARPAMPTRPTDARTSTHSTTVTQPGSGTPGSINPGGMSAAGAWVMPHPSYPRTPLAQHLTGATTVRIITDATGRVSNVVIVKSAGNPLLDSQTENFVREHWHGPPNASRTTEFVYEIK